jgi:hypothetical protein
MPFPVILIIILGAILFFIGGGFLTFNLDSIPAPVWIILLLFFGYLLIKKRK